MRVGFAALAGMLALAAGIAWAEPERQSLASMTGAELAAMQRRLADGGCYSGPLDGKASDATRAAMLACPDQRPKLVIETGMHISRIGQMAVDRACKLAATVSLDKTIRLWALPEGRPLRTIRPALADDDNGKLYAVAMSPDGRFLVAGGWDARYEVKKEMHAYVFDAATGAQLARLGTFASVVRHLAFSADGRWLAINLGDPAVAVFDTSSASPPGWREVMRDTDYKGDTYNAAFAPNGSLATVSYDGKIRLYEPGPSFRKSREVKVVGATQAFGLAFDPSGERLAVGYNDKIKVDFFDGRDLKPILSADVNGIGNGNLSAMAWQADGKRLWTGGKFDIKGNSPAVYFDASGKRPGQPVELGNNTVMDFRPCGAGVAFASADPVFGLINGNGAAKILRATVAIDMRDKLRDAFTVSANGKAVRFGLDYGGKSPLRFDLDRASLAESAAEDPALTKPRTDGLAVTRWEDTQSPMLGDKPIKLRPSETSRSLAIAKDGKGFVLGTEWYLRRFDGNGALIWQKDSPSVTYGVNISGDGRLIVAADKDGTIRWHRWSDGQELLALFVNHETRAWVAWTPTGYYSASPGGEEMIGWNVNRGWDQAADFFPADRFRSQFARPDIVERILDTLDESEAIRQANAARPVKTAPAPSVLESLPPVISILSPADGAVAEGGSLSINYIVRSPSGLPVDAIEARADGRPLAVTGAASTLSQQLRQCLEETHGLGRTEGALQGCRGALTVEAPQASASISLSARSGARFSEAASLRVVRPAAAPPGPNTVPGDTLKPKMYALVIGVADYINPAYRLSLPAKDARDFAAALIHQKGGLYGDVTVQLITDRAATLTAIKRGLEWLKRSTTARDVAVLYFAGHGEIEVTSGGFYLLPADADATELFATALAREDINRVLDRVPGKAIVFLDACHSAAIGGQQVRGLGAVNINDVVTELANADNGVVLFAASTGKQLSLENPAWGNGAFTKAVVEGLGLEGVAARANLLGKQSISLSELDAFVASRVKELTNGAQSPVMMNPKGVPNFPLALAR